MAPRRARIVLADHQTLFRQSLVTVLRSGGHTIAGEAGDLERLDQILIGIEPDIVMIDRYLPGGDSMEFIQSQHVLQPQTHLILLIAYRHEAEGVQASAFLAGAAGCLSKDLEPQEYLTAVRRVLDDQLLFHPDVMRRAARPQVFGGPTAQLRDLTQRELQILQLVSEGKNNQDVADRLGISAYTAMKHVSNIIKKLHVSNRMEAGLLYLRYGAGARLSDTLGLEE
jgi:DNA-binding NarL/FixJ family response regulator